MKDMSLDKRIEFITNHEMYTAYINDCPKQLIAHPSPPNNISAQITKDWRILHNTKVSCESPYMMKELAEVIMKIAATDGLHESI